MRTRDELGASQEATRIGGRRRTVSIVLVSLAVVLVAASLALRATGHRRELATTAGSSTTIAPTSEPTSTSSEPATASSVPSISSVAHGTASGTPPAPDAAAPSIASITVTPSVGTVESDMTITVVIRNPTSSGYLEMTWLGQDVFDSRPAVSTTPCQDVPLGPTEVTYVAHRSWRTTGPHTIFVNYFTCLFDNRLVEPVDANVGGDGVASNGPTQPTAGVDPQPSDGLIAAVVGFGTDGDGVVQVVSIDWGDGSAPTQSAVHVSEASGPLWIIDDPAGAACDPSAGYRDFGSGATTNQVTHSYAAAGSYVVTATVTSEGCHGELAQSATATTTVTASAP